MLKIKDNVDLKELAKNYNFTLKYNEDTGEIEELYRINGHYLGEKEKRRVTTVIRREMFSLNDKQRLNVWQIFSSNRNVKAGFSLSSAHQDLDVLFDLIKADLVEKV